MRQFGDPLGVASSPGDAAAALIKSAAGAERGSKPASHPWAVLSPTSAYLAQPRGCSMSRWRPQRYVEHDDAIHDNERGNHHDEYKIPDIQKPDVTAPHKQKALAALYLTNTTSAQLVALLLDPPQRCQYCPGPSAYTICCGHEGDSQQFGHPAVGLPLPQLHRGEGIRMAESGEVPSSSCYGPFHVIIPLTTLAPPGGLTASTSIFPGTCCGRSSRISGAKVQRA